MLLTDELLRPFMVDCNVCKIVMDLMMNNPDHSILHYGGRLLIVALFEYPVTRPRAIEDCLRPIIAARTTDNRALRASLFTIVRMIIKLRTGMGDLKAVSGFAELLKAVRQNSDLMNTMYGGIPPL
jgi:hypothetical protein